MARRPLAGRDTKLIQAHRRDEFFARMRRKGGVPRLPTQAPEVAEPEDEVDESALAESGEAAEVAGESGENAASETAADAAATT